LDLDPARYVVEVGHAVLIGSVSVLTETCVKVPNPLQVEGENPWRRWPDHTVNRLSIRRTIRRLRGFGSDKGGLFSVQNGYDISQPARLEEFDVTVNGHSHTRWTVRNEPVEPLRMTAAFIDARKIAEARRLQA
jgi:hypothetical protein